MWGSTNEQLIKIWCHRELVSGLHIIKIQHNWGQLGLAISCEPSFSSTVLGCSPHPNLGSSNTALSCLAAIWVWTGTCRPGAQYRAVVPAVFAQLPCVNAATHSWLVALGAALGWRFLWCHQAGVEGQAFLSPGLLQPHHLKWSFGAIPPLHRRHLEIHWNTIPFLDGLKKKSLYVALLLLSRAPQQPREHSALISRLAVV